MAKTEAIVLGAGVVGTSIALHLVKRGLAVALVDCAPPGMQTSYGNAGIIEGHTVFPPSFPADIGTLLRVALKRSAAANYHAAFLPRVLPWLLAFRAASRPDRLRETAAIMRPFYAAAVSEHEALMRESGAEQHLRRTGWLKVFRETRSIEGLKAEMDVASRLGVPVELLDVDAARAIEPALAPVFRAGQFWPTAASIDDPLAVTRAYAARFAALSGMTVTGDAMTLHRAGAAWRVETAAGALDAKDAIVALGPWAPDLLARFGIRLPMGVKRGYHRHFRGSGPAPLTRPVLDSDAGYLITRCGRAFA